MAAGAPTTCLHFKSNSNIVFSKNVLRYYHNTTHFDPKEVRNRNWHEITVHHYGKYTKKEILKALFITIGNIAFYPVKYIEDNKEDRFYVRICYEALSKLFENKLILKTEPRAPELYLSVRLNIAESQKGNILPEQQIENVIEYQFRRLKKHCGVSDVLDLEEMTEHRELDEAIIYLGVPVIFNVLCEKLSKMTHVINNINGINLSSNNITSLIGVLHFEKAEWEILDLRLNKISNINQIYKLQCIGLKALHIAGNPISNHPDTLHLIRDRLTSLKKLNGALIKDIDNIADVSNVDPCEVELNGKLAVVERYAELYTESSPKWVLIKVEHKGRFSQDEIVKAIFDAVTTRSIPDPFLICYYKTGKTEDTFLVRNQFPHIRYILKNYNLNIPIKNETVKLKLLLEAGDFREEHISEKSITMALRKCYNNRILNLGKFSSSPVFKNKLLLNMGAPEVYGKYLTTYVSKYEDIYEVNLSDNGIRYGIGLQSLKSLERLKLLNLANNNIRELRDLESIRDHPVKELILDGNPLCKRYKSAKDYIAAVTRYFPDLLFLDGIELRLQDIFIPKKNYLCNLKAFDLVEQFVSKYFQIFDTEHKENTINMYSSNAIFTLSNYSKHTLRRAKFTNCSRDWYDCTRNVFVGSNIYDLFQSLPDFEHDFKSFTTDVHFYTEDLIIVTITGVFKLLTKSIFDVPAIFSFFRTFVLKRVESATNIGIFSSTTEYDICNDQLAVNDLSVKRVDQIFKIQNPEVSLDTTAVTNEDKTGFFLMFQQITRLKSQWCARCLDEGDYDFHKSLEVFLDYARRKKFPEHVFLKH